MVAVNLSVSAYGVNADVNSRFFCDALNVTNKGEKWRSDLQATFAKRLKEEMESRQLSGNGLARIAAKNGHRLGQPTISRILDGKQDPSLERVYAIAEALGLPAWFLLTDASHAEQRVIRTPTPPTNVHRLGSPYQRILTPPTKPKGAEKPKSRKHNRG